MTEKLKGKRVLWIDPEKSFVAAGIVLGQDMEARIICIQWELQDPRRKEPLFTWVKGVDVLVPVPAIPLADWLKSQGERNGPESV